MDTTGPTVGRDEELGRLLELLQPGAGAKAAVILGEPGIGKTHLLEAFLARAADGGTRVVVAQSRPGTAAIPAGAFLDVLPTSPPAGDDATVLWWARNTLIGTDRHAPIVIALEDAHHADKITIAICDHLVVSGAAVVVITARSTEPSPIGFRQFRDRHDVDTVVLEPLEPTGTAVFARRIAGAPVSDATAREIHRLTDGVPLAIRELVRAAAESGTPVSSDSWEWNETLARGARLESLLRGRLERTAPAAQQILWMLTVAGGSIPASVVGADPGAVREAIERGLVERVADWLEWSHPLLGEVAGAIIGPTRVEAARRALLAGLLDADLSDSPRATILVARLELAAPAPRPDLLLAGAEAALASGHHDDVVDFTQALLELDPASHDARLFAALEQIGTADDTIVRATVRDLLAAATTVEQQHRTITLCLQRLHDSGRDPRPVIELATAGDFPFAAGVAAQIAFLHASIGIDASSPEETVRLTREVIDAADASAPNRAAAQGMLSIMLAAMGEVEEATELAARARAGPLEEVNTSDQLGGFYGGALAALFSGEASAARALVVEGSERLLQKDDPTSQVVHGSVRYSLDPPSGRAGTPMIGLVPLADRIGSLRYGVVLRLHALWELALLRDPRAATMWDQIQAAPASLRTGPAFLEAFGGVALHASTGDTAGAAKTALAIAEAMAPARSAAAWLLHDAARHGRADDAIEPLRRIAATQAERFLPAILADSAEAIAVGDPEGLAATASDFRNRGFDLFAAENDTLASLAARRQGDDAAAARAAARAANDRTRIEGTATPILDRLEGHPLTDRQRTVCRLAAAGLSNGEIAERLVLSKRTVENQLHRAYATLGVDRAGLRGIEL